MSKGKGCFLGNPKDSRLGRLGNLREHWNHHPPLKNPITRGGYSRLTISQKLSRVIPGTPNNGTPLWEASHAIPISLGIREWEWYGNSMGPAYHKGVPCPWGSLKIPLKLEILPKHV